MEKKEKKGKDREKCRENSEEGGKKRDKLTNEFITIRFPWRWLLSGSIEFIIKKTKCFLAAKRISREQGTVSCREFNFNVHPVRGSPLNKWRPKPIVHVIVGNIANHITPPVDSLVEVGERLLHPLKSKKEKNFIFPHSFFYSLSLYI